MASIEKVGIEIDALLLAENQRLRGLLLWLLWHHQGGSSEVGQPIRKALGIGPHEPMTTKQVAEAQQAGGRFKTQNVKSEGAEPLLAKLPLD